MTEQRPVDELSGEIVHSAYLLHKGLGPGLLESVYGSALARALERHGLLVERQKLVSFDYDGQHFSEGFRVDLLVEERIVIEIKSIDQLLPVHTKQVVTYLRLLNLQVGLLINFGGYTLKEGLKRVVNGYERTHFASPVPPRLRANETTANAGQNVDEKN